MMGVVFFFFNTAEVGKQYKPNLITYFVDCLGFKKKKNEGKKFTNTD